jgi:hypothetical protein
MRILEDGGQSAADGERFVRFRFVARSGRSGGLIGSAI